MTPIILALLLLQIPIPIEANPWPGPLYELTQNDFPIWREFPFRPQWTSRNVTILGAKIGDITNKVVGNFGKMNHTRTLSDEYLTVFHDNGLFVFTKKITGETTRFEIFPPFPIADIRLKRLLSEGDIEFMRALLGPEDRIEVNNTDPSAPSTQYVYEQRGFRFIRFQIGKRTLHSFCFYKIGS